MAEELDDLSVVLKQAPFINLLGIQASRISKADGVVETQMLVRPEHDQHTGVIHAGVCATMADHTAGAAASTALRKGQYVLTSSFHIVLLRPAVGRFLRCRSRIVRKGRVVIVVESQVFCDESELDISTPVCTATVILVVVNGGPAVSKDSTLTDAVQTPRTSTSKL